LNSKKGEFPIPAFDAVQIGDTGTFTEECFTPNGSQGTWRIDDLVQNSDDSATGTHASMKITYSFPELSINTICAYLQEINRRDDNVNFSISLRGNVTTNTLSVHIVRKDNQEIWTDDYSFLMTLLF